MKRDLNEIRSYARASLNRLDETHKRLVSAHVYVAGLENSLYIKRHDLRIQALQGKEKQYED